MKKILFVIVLSSTLSWAQLLLEENFDYSTGILTNVSSSWTESPIGSMDVQVYEGNLSYNNYLSNNIGRLIKLDGGANGRSGIKRNFSIQSTNITIYWSFLLNVVSTSNMDSSTGDYFANFQTSDFLNRAYVYIKQGSNASKYNVGLAKTSSSSLTWYNNELDINTTYLIVVAYSFITGSGNDIAKLWVNPNLSVEEPNPDISITSGTDANDISAIQFRQRSKSGDMYIDGIRVATSWTQAPLPVELTSFTASLINKTVQLNWSTATEVNNYGFNVERKEENKDWKKIGFVNGNGNSNSPKNYSFIDDYPPVGRIQYRLKQIDYDGAFEYSPIVEIEVSAPNKIELHQNKPNPFNPRTTIVYSITALTIDQSNVMQHVTIKVYDILGREVAILVDDYKQPGYYKVEFSADKLNGNPLPSGIYFYTLQSENYYLVKKMILAK